jgi:hypothetical protein
LIFATLESILVLCILSLWLSKTDNDGEFTGCQLSVLTCFDPSFYHTNANKFLATSQDKSSTIVTLIIVVIIGQKGVSTCVFVLDVAGPSCRFRIDCNGKITSLWVADYMKNEILLAGSKI